MATASQQVRVGSSVQDTRPRSRSPSSTQDASNAGTWIVLIYPFSIALTVLGIALLSH
jgi:hypothetical protein